MAESPFDDDITEISELANTPSLEATERYAAKRQRWEENVVKRILNLAGKGQLVKELINRHHDRNNEYKLTFDAFKREFPEFPLFLGFEKPSYKSLIKLESQLLHMRKSDKNILVKLFHDFCDIHCVHEQGIVFEWLHHGSPYKLIHNYSGNLPLNYPHTRITLTTSDNALLHLEDLDCFLKATQWTKEEI